MSDYKSPLPVKTNPGDTVAAEVTGVSTGDFSPQGDSDLALGEKAPLKLDGAGNLITRSTVLTDEGANFNGCVCPYTAEEPLLVIVDDGITSEQDALIDTLVANEPSI